MKKFAGTAFVLAAVLTMVLEGNFIHNVVLLMAIGYAIVPAGFIVGICSLIAARRGLRLEWSSSFWRFAAISLGAVFFSGVTGFAMHEWRVHESRAFVKRAVTVLDQIHATNGRYPLQLPVSELGSPPKWLRGPNAYQVNDDQFRFQYWDPAGMMDGYEFTSETRAWIYFD